MNESIETVIVGGGQAGLAMSFYLSHCGREHVIVERARVAERWRTQRWDSLMFQFPNWSIGLPGRSYAGRDPEGFSHKSDIVAFIEDYAASIKAPLRTGVEVRSLRRAPHPGRYLLSTDAGTFEARNVVIATGPYQRPRLPAVAAGMQPGFFQVHAGEYRNPRELPPGGVLVVGSGASGCQIAEELLLAGRAVFFARRVLVAPGIGTSGPKGRGHAKGTAGTASTGHRRWWWPRRGHSNLREGRDEAPWPRSRNS
jgi:putative flavoprotein involved in K+ transport